MTFVITLAGITGPSYWLDEAATVSMLRRSMPDFMRTIDHIDLVHATYYLLMRPWAKVFGHGELALRLPSAVAMALAAGVVALVGRRCASPSVGLAAGLAFGASVSISRYGQDARPFAMLTLAVVLASYLFVRMVTARRVWVWTIAYALSLIAVCLFNLFGLMVVLAHGVTLLWLHRTGGTPFRTLVRWLVTAGATGLVLLPFAVKANGQSDQVVIKPPEPAVQIWNLFGFLAGHREMIVLVAVIAGIGVAAPVARTVSRPAAPERTAGPTLAMLAAPWLVIPPALLLVANVFEPIFRPRYVLFALPALSLLLGAGLVWLAQRGRPLLAGAVAALAVLSLPAHLEVREQAERGDDLRLQADILREHARPGDAVLYISPTLRWRAEAYPDAFKGLRDVLLDETPQQAANFVGVTTHRSGEVRRRLLEGDRVWVMRDRTLDKFPPRDLRWRLRMLDSTGPYTTVGRWSFAGGSMTLMVRRPAPPAVTPPGDGRTPRPKKTPKP
ncbi:MAG TPA: glycosyltransferase family 39 protein [Thermomonospora sp.]|nr:glycosyltransferase family 39 protein [Thermomonospora sp.]